nr:MAG TPA: hypothetical protein [Caudoviricetes sp.]
MFIRLYILTMQKCTTLHYKAVHSCHTKVYSLVI